jgi:hypothetical protein
VLLSHEPPKRVGRLDLASHRRQAHAGSDMLVTSAHGMAVPPALWICGHIHEGYGAAMHTFRAVKRASTRQASIASSKAESKFKGFGSRNLDGPRKNDGDEGDIDDAIGHTAEIAGASPFAGKAGDAILADGADRADGADGAVAAVSSDSNSDWASSQRGTRRRETLVVNACNANPGPANRYTRVPTHRYRYRE